MLHTVVSKGQAYTALTLLTFGKKKNKPADTQKEKQIASYINIPINYIYTYISIFIYWSLSSFTFLAWQLRSSMICPQIPFQAYLWPVVASSSPTTHSRPHLPENASSLDPSRNSHTTMLYLIIFSLCLKYPFHVSFPPFLRTWALSKCLWCSVWAAHLHVCSLD